MGSSGSPFSRSDSTIARKRFSSVRWGALAFVAGAHAAGLLALSGLLGGFATPAPIPVSAPATLSVRLIAPPAPVMSPAVISPSVPAPAAAPPKKVTPRHPIAKPALRSRQRTPAPAATSPHPTAEILPPAEAPRHADVPPDHPPRPVAQATPSPSPSGSATTADAPSAVTTLPASQPATVALTPASFDAAYLHNPAPIYPRSSRRRGDEGKVVLRVHVLGDGSADAVEVAESSGHARLDDAAREAVRTWRFTPAKRGETQIDSWLLVPIVFRLED